MKKRKKKYKEKEQKERLIVQQNNTPKEQRRIIHVILFNVFYYIFELIPIFILFVLMVFDNNTVVCLDDCLKNFILTVFVLGVGLMHKASIRKKFEESTINIMLCGIMLLACIFLIVVYSLSYNEPLPHGTVLGIVGSIVFIIELVLECNNELGV